MRECCLLLTAPHIRMLRELSCFFGGICCLLPLCLRPLVDYDESVLNASLMSGRRQDSGIAAFAIALPLLMNVISDTLAARRSTRNHILGNHTLLNMGERLLIACGMLTIVTVGLLPLKTDYMVNVYFCLRRCRATMVVGAIAISLARYDAKIWTVRRTNTTVFLVICGSLTSAFASNLSSSSVTQFSASSIYLAGILNLLVCNITWLIPFISESCRRFGTPKVHTEQLLWNRDATHTDTLHAFLFIGTTTLLLILTTITSTLFPDVRYYNDDAVFYNHLGSILYLVFIVNLCDRKSKCDTMTGLCDLIDAKKTYARYISHELRTPLNTASLGLKLISDDISGSTNHNITRHTETLTDVQAACRTAVEILNDLLCFDKLESGILELHKHDVTVIPFIDDCVNLFASQAREAGVTVTYIASPPVPLNTDFSTSATATTPSHAMGLLDDDFVHMDKFKMDQVLRNLISNALKFTPRGGSVSVCATFVPALVSKDASRGRTQTSFLRSLSKSAAVAPVDTPASGWDLLFGQGTFSFPKASREQEDIEAGCAVRTAVAPIGNVSRLNNSRHSNIDLTAGWWGQSAWGGTTSPTRPVDIDLTSAPGTFRCIKSHGLKKNEEVYRGKLRITVTDTGAGISQENQLLLFKEIVQFNPEVLQAGGGSGLGLWITSSIVKMHGGSISVHSAGLGKGSSFTVEIDMQRMLSDRLTVPSCGLQIHPIEEIPPQPARWDSNEEKNGDRTIGLTSCDFNTEVRNEIYDTLVVDDSGLNRKMLCRLFRSQGYTCEEADDGLKAVQKVRDKMATREGSLGEYDVILMDFVMPNMDGPTATKEIRDLGYRGRIFGLTGNALESDVNYFKEKGADEVLAKPFNVKNFQQLMRNAR